MDAEPQSRPRIRVKGALSAPGGIKIVHRRYLPRYLANSRVNDLAFDVELLMLLREFGAGITEVPTTWSAQPGPSTLGTVSGFARQTAQMTRSLLLLWWRMRRNQRPSVDVTSGAGGADSGVNPSTPPEAKPHRERGHHEP